MVDMAVFLLGLVLALAGSRASMWGDLSYPFPVPLYREAGDEHPRVLDGGVWVVSIDPDVEPLQVVELASWNSWAWDPVSGDLWFHRLPDDYSDDSPRYLSRASFASDGSVGERQDYDIAGHVLPSPVGGAVLVRSWTEVVFPEGWMFDVFIAEADGRVHWIGTQQLLLSSDSFIPAAAHAEWSPDGRYVVLRERAARDNESVGGAFSYSIYDRGGMIPRGSARPPSSQPYVEQWFLDAGLRGHVSRPLRNEHPCNRERDVFGRRLHECIWSPDRQWVAVLADLTPTDQSLRRLLGHNWLGLERYRDSYPPPVELRLHAADASLAGRWLMFGYPCMMFSWSPDSTRLAYGGPRLCA